MFPVAGSTRRKRATSRELFPAPVLPTMPSFSPGSTWNCKPLRTSGRPSRYLNWNSLKTTRPCDGHADGGVFVLMRSGASLSMLSVYANSRSTAFMFVSRSAAISTRTSRRCTISNPYVKAIANQATTREKRVRKQGSLCALRCLLWINKMTTR